MFSFKKAPIYNQVHNFSDWRAVRYPWKAITQSNEILRFVEFSRIKNANEITEKQLQDYFNTFNSEGLRHTAFLAFRQFFTYCKIMGYVDIKVAPLTHMGTITGMQKIHPLIHVGQVERVHKLRKQGLSFRNIKYKMEEEDNRNYDLNQIHRWAHYKLSPTG